MKTRYNYLFLVFCFGLVFSFSCFYLSAKNYFNTSENKVASKARPSRAIASIQEDQPVDMYNNALILYSQNRSEAFLTVVHEMLEKYPEDPYTGMALLKMAKFLKTNGRVDEAQSLMKKLEAHFANGEQGADPATAFEKPVNADPTKESVETTAAKPSRDLSSEKPAAAKPKTNKYREMFRRRFLHPDLSTDG